MLNENSMKKSIVVIVLVMAAMSVFAQKEMTFVVEGPEKSYNQVRVVNETSLENFNCRVIVYNEDKSQKEVYGSFELKERGDSDSNTKSLDRIPKGATLGIQLPKSVKKPLSFYVEYKDYPLFDVIVIHLTDSDGGYEEI